MKAANPRMKQNQQPAAISWKRLFAVHVDPPRLRRLVVKDSSNPAQRSGSRGTRRQYTSAGTRKELGLVQQA